MRPFDTYPGGGRELLGQARGSNSRHEYGRQLMQLSGQRKCAYCETDLTGSYEQWLTMVVDHVVPKSHCGAAGIPVRWYEDLSNMVLACAACNSFRNRYRCDWATQPTSLDEFYALRDKVFTERKQLIDASHRTERAFYDTKPWEISNRDTTVASA